MKTLICVLAVLAFPVTEATHDGGCVPGQADPSTLNIIDLPDGTRLYVEERGVPAPLGTSPPIPLSAFFVGEGTWIYKETNGLKGMQRGDASYLFCIPPDDPLCHPMVDPVSDEDCGHGPDTLMF